MTVFLTPTGEPFYAGTYFPPEPRHGMPASRSSWWPWPTPGATAATTSPQQAEQLVEAIGEHGADRAVARAAHGRDCSIEAGRGICATVRPGVRRFRPCPQVPPGDDARVPAAPRRTGTRRWRWSRRRSTPWPRAGSTTSVGGGFHRYSVDDRWLVPHFEKMLYDNALLAARLPARVGRHRRAALPAGRRGDARLRACASCATRTAASRRPRTPTPMGWKG